jgi:sarcosine oxidase, subunit alpha
MKNDWFRKNGLTFFPKSGIKVNGTLLQLRKTVLEILDNCQVEGVLTADIDSNGDMIPGTEKIHKADFVFITGGLYSLAELAAVTRCPFQ